MLVPSSMMYLVMSALVGILSVPTHAETLFFASDADPFLGRVAETRPHIHRAIEQVLHNSHRGDIEGRLSRLEQQLHPTFNSLPKNENGRLGSTVVRYLLHRHFLRRHAWLIHGLAPEGSAWNASSPLLMLKDHVPSVALQLIEHHLHGRGLDLHETAVIAAMLENQVHDDAVKRLHAACGLHELPYQGTVSLGDMERVLDTYMASYLLSDMVAKQADPDELIKQAVLMYPAFPRTQSFVRRLLRTVVPGLDRELSFADAEQVVVEISEQYGHWQDDECNEMREELLGLEGPQPGHVDIRKFYRKAMVEGRWQYSESVPYMRALGVLDESDPERPNVIVPNYIVSPSQFIASSHFYAVTCLDECEKIMDHLEREIAAPYATVGQIASLIAPRATHFEEAFSAPLRRRLEEVAAHHGGYVPLHGRLFQQWLHFMYPRQCPYPHVAGSTHPQEPEAFQARTGIGVLESKKSMRMFIETLHEQEQHEEANEGLEGASWVPVEELLAEPCRASIAARLQSVTTPHVLITVAALSGAVMVSVAALSFLCRQVSPALAPSSGQLLTVDAQ